MVTMHENGSETKRPRRSSSIDEICSSVASRMASRSQAGLMMTTATTGLHTGPASQFTSTASPHRPMAGSRSLDPVPSTTISPPHDQALDLALNKSTTTPGSVQTLRIDQRQQPALRKYSWPPDSSATPRWQVSHTMAAASSASFKPDDMPETSSPKSDSGKASYSGDESGKERRRRQKLANKDNLYCQVCGDKANGHNFGAITCESCKAFFRRNAMKNKELRCNFESACKIDNFTRKFCTACRLAKCFSVNMKKEWILDEDALKKRKKLTRRSSMREEGACSDFEPLAFPTLTTSQVFGAASLPTSTLTTMSAARGMPVYLDRPALLPSATVRPDLSVNTVEECDYSSPIPLSETENNEIRRIMLNHSAIDNDGCSRSDSPPSTQVKEEPVNMDTSSTEFPSETTTSISTSSDKSIDLNHVQVLNIADGFIRKLIKFVKTLAEYQGLDQIDQIALLKGGIMETLVIRAAICYNQNLSGTRDSFSVKLRTSFIQHGLGQVLYEEHIRHLTSFNTIAKWDKVCLVLTLVINLFNAARPGVVNRERVKAAESRYSLLLQSYLRSKYNGFEANALFPQLLLKLSEIRNYGEQCANHIANVSPSRLEPLMREIFSMK